MLLTNECQLFVEGLALCKVLCFHSDTDDEWMISHFLSLYDANKMSEFTFSKLFWNILFIVAVQWDKFSAFSFATLDLYW
jgi:hypothetical protein